MPTRKVSDRERLTIFARTATDDELEAALEILRVEAQVRKATKQPAKKTATKKPEKAVLPTKTEGDNDNPQG